MKKHNVASEYYSTNKSFIVVVKIHILKLNKHIDDHCSIKNKAYSHIKIEQIEA